eukprot:TRINITY_DN59901_c0_g1_i1.p1 TRINITY_DN59901_c0_g1~~TRINITY_DN59901_c0_g1_i1.p1  ORF type:complete len:429 (+),score=110.66 TRINITY_DN59901_c0_g1_i1:73-1359(+)
MAMNPTASAATVVVRFFTTTYDRDVPDQTFSVPYTVTPEGLSSLVNKLLENADEDAVPFDFLRDGEFVTTSLDRYIKSHGISKEEVIELEYTPSLSLEEGNEIPHDDWVSSVACPFFGNADAVVTANYDRRVRVCCGAEVLAVGEGHRAAVKEVAAAPAPGAEQGGSRKRPRDVAPLVAVSGSKDGTVRVWQYSAAAGLRCARTIALHTDSVDSVAINQARDLAASASWDKSIRLWRLPDCYGDSAAPEGELKTAQLLGHSRAVLRCRFGPLGRSLYSAGMDGQVKEWDVGRAAHNASLVGEYAIYGLDVRESGGAEQIITGHSDNKARLWDTRQQRPAKSFAGHSGWIYDVRWCPPGCPGGAQQFVSASEDGEIHVHDLRAPRHLGSHHTHEDAVLGLCFATHDCVWSASKDTTARSTTLVGVTGGA